MWIRSIFCRRSEAGVGNPLPRSRGFAPTSSGILLTDSRGCETRVRPMRHRALSKDLAVAGAENLAERHAIGGGENARDLIDIGSSSTGSPPCHSRDRSWRSSAGALLRRPLPGSVGGKLENWLMGVEV